MSAITNPWGLTPAQSITMDALLEAGTNKGAARQLGIPVRTVESRLRVAREHMGDICSLHALIAWARFRGTV